MEKKRRLSNIGGKSKGGAMSPEIKGPPGRGRMEKKENKNQSNNGRLLQ
jgi:hypothetical protein